MIKEFCDRCKKELLRQDKREIIKDGSTITLCPSCDNDFEKFISNPKKNTELLNIGELR